MGLVDGLESGCGVLFQWTDRCGKDRGMGTSMVLWNVLCSCCVHILAVLLLLVPRGSSMSPAM